MASTALQEAYLPPLRVFPLTILFWLLIAVDTLAWLLFFVLGLAAATSTRQSAIAVAFSLPFAVPLLVLVLAVVLFTKSPSGVGRLIALLLAAAPALILFWAKASATREMRLNTTSTGEVAYYREGPLRELATAIRANDTATVSKLLPTVDVNADGFQGITPLMLAVRQLEHTPKQLDVLRMLLAAKADPNKIAERELPLEVAIQQGQHAGAEPVLMMLKAGANPNTKNEWGSPVYFMGTGITVPIEVLTTLLDNGADLRATGKSGNSVVFDAALTQNWKAVMLLLERGADYKTGKTLNGLTFEQMIETHSRSYGDTAGLNMVAEYLKTHK